eukprot:1410340-Rhodomonas_salina.1
MSPLSNPPPIAQRPNSLASLVYRLSQAGNLALPLNFQAWNPRPIPKLLRGVTAWGGRDQRWKRDVTRGQWGREQCGTRGDVMRVGERKERRREG